MITAQEMVNEVDNFRNRNQKIIEELKTAAEAKIVQAAKSGRKKANLSTDSLLMKCPSYRTLENINTTSLFEALVEELVKNVFEVCKVSCFIEVYW